MLCTQEDVERQLQIRFDNDPEPVVAYLIENATGLIRDHCGQHLESQDGLTVTVDGTGGPWLFMPETPIRAVSAVVEDGRTLGADEFVWYRDGSLLRVNGRWVRKPQAVTVTYDAGYHPIPAGLRAVCASMVARAFTAAIGLLDDDADGDPRPKVSEAKGNYSVTWLDMPVDVALSQLYVTADDAKALGPYRREVVA